MFSGAGLTITWCWKRNGFSPYRPSVGRITGSTYAVRHGFGPRQRRKVAGFIVPAATSVWYGCMRTQPWSAQYRSSAAIVCWKFGAAKRPILGKKAARAAVLLDDADSVRVRLRAGLRARS